MTFMPYTRTDKYERWGRRPLKFCLEQTPCYRMIVWSGSLGHRGAIKNTAVQIVFRDMVSAYNKGMGALPKLSGSPWSPFPPYRAPMYSRLQLVQGRMTFSVRRISHEHISISLLFPAVRRQRHIYLLANCLSSISQCSCIRLILVDCVNYNDWCFKQAALITSHNSGHFNHTKRCIVIWLKTSCVRPRLFVAFSSVLLLPTLTL